MNFKLRSLVAATLVGSFSMGFGAVAMADTTTDTVKPAMDFMNDDAPFKSNFMLGEHQADIQIYGIIDVGGASQNHSLPANGALPNNLYPYQGAPIGKPNVQSQSAWINGGLQDSRIGLKGSIGLFEANENKFKLIYQIETGFNPITGELNNAAATLAQNSGSTAAAYNSVHADSSLNGYMFARQAWAGIDGGKLGKVSYGIQYNPVYDILGAYDPTGKADTFSPFGESGAIGGGGGISEDSRMKNSFKYANSFAAPMDGKINGAVMYQIGNAFDTSHGYGATAQLGYENSLFGVQMAYDKFTDAPKAASSTTAGTFNTAIGASLYNTDSFLLAGKVMPTKSLTVYGGWEWYQLQASTDSILAYSSIFGYSNAATDGTDVKSKFSSGVTQDNNVYYVGAKFDFAENMPALTGLTAALGYYATRADASSDAGATVKQGSIDTTTLVVDYKINKRFDTYFAYSNNHFSGAANSTNYANVDIAGAGVRMKF